MPSIPTFRHAALVFLLLSSSFAAAAGFAKLTLPPETPAVLDKIYSFDIAGAVEAAKRMEQERSDHPLGYLLEAEALWWKIWCTSADFKYGMSDARRRRSSKRISAIFNWPLKLRRWPRRRSSSTKPLRCSSTQEWLTPRRRGCSRFVG